MFYFLPRYTLSFECRDAGVRVALFRDHRPRSAPPRRLRRRPSWIGSRPRQPRPTGLWVATPHAMPIAHAQPRSHKRRREVTPWAARRGLRAESLRRRPDIAIIARSGYRDG